MRGPASKASRKVQKYLVEYQGVEPEDILANRRDLGWGESWHAQVICEGAEYDWAIGQSHAINTDETLNPDGYASHVMAEPYNGFILSFYVQR